MSHKYLYSFPRICLLILLNTFLAASCTRPGAITWNSSEINTELNKTRQTHHIPAIATVVIRADTVLQGATVGVRSLENTEQVTPDDIFYLGSLSKAITATIIASLVEEGKLSWESRPEDVFPEWKNDIHPALREITLDQMLRHSSGLTAYLEEDSPEVKALPSFPDDPVAGREAFARYAVQHAPLFTPGSRRRYSNAGYAIAAAMAEKVSGMAWEKLAQERLFSPLGMPGAAYGRPSKAEAFTLVRGHVHKGDTLEPLNPAAKHQPAWRSPAEDVFISLRDYVRFLQEHLQGLRGNNGLLEASTIQYLHEPMGIDPEGLGWDIEKTEEIKRSSHASSREGFYNTVLLQADSNIGVVVLGSSMRETDEEALNGLLAWLVSKYSNSRIQQEKP